MAVRQDDNIREGHQGHQFHVVKCTIWPFERKWKRKLQHVKTDMLRPPFSEPDDLLQPEKGQQENINWLPYRF